MERPIESPTSLEFDDLVLRGARISHHANRVARHGLHDDKENDCDDYNGRYPEQEPANHVLQHDELSLRNTWMAPLRSSLTSELLWSRAAQGAPMNSR